METTIKLMMEITINIKLVAKLNFVVMETIDRFGVINTDGDFAAQFRYLISLEHFL